MSTSRYPVTIHNNERIAGELDKPLEPWLISERDGARNVKYAYVKGDISPDLLNEIFGPLGWSVRSSIVSRDSWESEKQDGNTVKDMYNISVVAHVELTIKSVEPGGADTVISQHGTGYGEVELNRNRSDALKLAIKGADTDGLKRCCNLLGRRMGMFLTNDGRQDEVHYAHANNRNTLNRALRMRDEAKRGKSEPNNGENAGRGDNHGRRDEARQEPQRRDSSPRDEGRRPSQEASSRSNDNRATPPRDNGPRNETPRGESRERNDDRPRNDHRDRDDRGGHSSESRREAGSSQRNEGRPQSENKDSRREPQDRQGQDIPPTAVNRNYNLSHIPVTRQEMLDYGETLVSSLQFMNQTSDKEKFIKQHFKTIQDLDPKIRNRVIDELGKCGIDLDALGF